MIKTTPVFSTAFMRWAGFGLLGMVHALSFAPYPLPSWALPFVQIFALATLFVFIYKNAATRQALTAVFIFGTFNFTTGLYWLFISLHYYGGMIWPLAALGVLLLAMFLSLYYVIAVLVARWLTGKLAYEIKTWPSQLLYSLSWASCWTAAEWLRGTLFTGFPWLNLGYAHAEGVLAPWAPVLGVYGLTWLAVFAASAIAMLVCHKEGASNARAAVGLGLAIISGLIGIVLSHAVWTTPYGTPIIVRLIQGQVPQTEKFDPDHVLQGIQHYMQLAALDAKSPDGQPQLIILPETVVPFFQDQANDALWQSWKDIATKQNAEIILGIPLRNTQRNHITNSAIALNAHTPIENLKQGQLELRYDKHHLVPFGEFIPPGFNWFVQAMHIPLGSFSRGPLSQPAFSLLGQEIAPNICYEDLFGEEIRQHVRADGINNEASILINMSNLAWFGDTWALRQHLQISRLRALETGRPMLRATNTGMTAAIIPTGQVQAVLNTQQPGVLDVEVQGMQGETPYIQWGNRPVLLFLTLILLFTLLQKYKAFTRFVQK